jgi:hypothetical protein
MLVAMNFGDKNLENDRSKFQAQQLEYQSFKKNLSTVLNPPKTKVEPVPTPSAPNNTEDKSKDNKILKSNPKRKPKTLVE